MKQVLQDFIYEARGIRKKVRHTLYCKREPVKARVDALSVSIVWVDLSDIANEAVSPLAIERAPWAISTWTSNL